MNRLAFSLLAATLIAGPSVAADPAQADLDQALAKAKKDKKYLAVVFTQFN